MPSSMQEKSKKNENGQHKKINKKYIPTRMQVTFKSRNARQSSIKHKHHKM